jgi:hypothetical protein
MGTFGGHALPGSFFIIFAFWWTIQMFRRYFASQRKGGLPFKSSATFPLDFICCGPAWLRRWEWEGFFKVFFTFIGFVGEVITAHHDGRFAYMGNGQHATMFFFFGLSGAVDILVHHRAPLPAGIEYLIATLAFVVEAMLFMFHLHGRTEFDVLIHTLLLYVVYFNIVVAILEMRYRHSITVALCRAFLVFLQGTWFWQAGFLLYNPLPGAVEWDQNNHDQMMVVTMMFAWHMAAVFIIMASIGAVVAACQARSCCGGVAGPDELGNGSRRYDGMRLLAQDEGECKTTVFHGELDSDSDTVDFEKHRQTPARVVESTNN